MTAGKKWEAFEHTADLGLFIYGDSLEELFRAAAEALTEQLTGPEPVQRRAARNVELEAESAEVLLRSWMAELLYLYHAEGWLTAEVEFERLDETALRAQLAGELFDEARHELGPEVKAVTWHRLKIERMGESGRLRATVILDV
ncbi:MAG TPA: archease [Candidatus Glassbacteria bacterium]|nr:archease [Candidatus Glassbacteria bacterium]